MYLIISSPGDAEVLCARGSVGSALRAPGQRQQPRIQVRTAAAQHLSYKIEFAFQEGVGAHCVAVSLSPLSQQPVSFR